MPGIRWTVSHGSVTMWRIMGFFEDVPQPVPAAPLPVSLTASLTGPVRAPWLAPPDHQLGGVVAAPPSLGVTGDTAVSIGGVVAYPSGVEITLEVRLRPGTAAGADPRLSVAWAREAQRMVRFGVVLPGGARVIAADPGVPLAARLDATADTSGTQDDPLLTVVDSWGPVEDWAGPGFVQPPQPAYGYGYGPGLAYRTFTAGFAGGRAPDVHRLRYWLWPLPPAGPLTLVVDFPARGLAESRVTVDGSALRAAAERAVTLWPAGDGLDEPGTPPVDVPTEAARVRAAFRRAFTGGQGEDHALSAVEGGPGLRDVLERVRERFPRQTTGARVLVGEPVFVDPGHARVLFEVVVPGASLGGVSVGAAVLVAGDWKVTTQTYTGVLARSGIGVFAG
ncbi:hypothetical protein E0504_23650 [Parafrankia sp. BMG5.11]|nr:hypothetical protein E0504_23650 [Parafrankia sp. BMG5.11]